MFIKESPKVKLLQFIRDSYKALFLSIAFLSVTKDLYSATSSETDTLTYYCYVNDFIESFIEIPTSNVSVGSPTISSRYLAGRSALYNTSDIESGTCSASFLCMQNASGIYTDISHYLSANDGLVVAWSTSTTLTNLELASFVEAMIAESTVIVATKVGSASLFGETFDLFISSDGEKLYFEFSRIGTIF
ncbi:MAG: hypothetical protein JSR76_05140 [Verrucomicrobia bacterium]|nr:hypothetical protein [Verrucomicrobiota bacterium]